MALNPAEPRGPYARTRDEAAELRAWYERGDPWAEMAGRLGLTPQALSYRLERLGLRPDRRTPRWEAAQHWPWPLTLAEVATRLYGASGPDARRRAGTLVNNWKRAGKLAGVGWARYDLARRSPLE